MKESKIDLTERLRREGRWAEASAFKDQVIRELRDSGMKGAEARERGWEEMARNFPPLPEPEPPLPGDSAGVEPGDGLGVLPEAWLEDGAPPDLARDVRWVYQHLENRLIQRVRGRPAATPSPLSQWGRFPIFTGVRVSHRATPTEVAP